MNRIPVESIHIVSVGYDSATHILEIEFIKDEIYQYSHIPQSVYAGLFQSSAKDEYFAAFIKDRYYYFRTN